MARRTQLQESSRHARRDSHYVRRSHPVYVVWQKHLCCPAQLQGSSIIVIKLDQVEQQLGWKPGSVWEFNSFVKESEGISQNSCKYWELSGQSLVRENSMLLTCMGNTNVE